MKSILLFAALVLLTSCSSAPPKTINEKYPWPWHGAGADNLKISSVLVANGITVCNEHYVRPGESGTWLVGCTPNNRRDWYYYEVNAETNKAMEVHDTYIEPPKGNVQ